MFFLNVDDVAKLEPFI